MMMGCCTATGMVFGLLGMLTPLIAIGAVISARRQTKRPRTWRGALR